MTRFSHTPGEVDVNRVLRDHERRLHAVSFDADGARARMVSSEALLAQLGYELPSRRASQRPPMAPSLPTWDELCRDSFERDSSPAALEELFTPEELEANRLELSRMREAFDAPHRLDVTDLAIATLGGLLGAAIDILLVGVPARTPEGLRAGLLSDHIRDAFGKMLPEEEMAKLANSKAAKVPFDAQDNRNTVVYVEGLSAYYHRLLQLGHDPLLGLLFGTMDVLAGTMTTIDKSGRIAVQVMECYADRTEQDVFAALGKTLLHFASDVNTAMGLPAPLMGLCNLLQFGRIGVDEQTVAEIVQGMYYEGYDFIHFCGQSVPTMVTEAVVRLGYALKRIGEGRPISEAIPFTTDRLARPKLATMLFVAHAEAAAANAGKVAFTKNPTAFSAPQWLAFARYAVGQAQWALLGKAEKRNEVVQAELRRELDEILAQADATYREVSGTLLLEAAPGGAI